MASPFVYTITLYSCDLHPKCLIVANDSGVPEIPPVPVHLELARACDYLTGCADWLVHRASL